MENRVEQQDNSRKVLAIVLIVLGILLVLKKSGAIYNFPFFHLNNVFFPFQNAFHSIGHVVFSWPVILLIVGIVLLAGRRSGGWVLVVIGGLFLLPKLFVLSGAAIVLLLPLILIGVGIAIVARLL
ncbi:LiaF transmembrane domain-containing protein [Maribellus sediminis]|uniref:LiaF transmembrane domain-containing protein n=1 Tax=Maribellus sediminis TaxID=2696285 RepID=UPI0014311D46|nr:hypothetical protein [Maribellus sediminis]